MNVIISIPLFIYLLIAINIFIFSSGVDPYDALNKIVIDFDLPSEAHASISISGLFILVGLLCLYFEILKATVSSNLTVVDHGLSLLVFIAFLVEFIVVKEMGNSTFLILMSLTLLDVVAGFTVSIATARRDIAFR